MLIISFLENALVFRLLNDSFLVNSLSKTPLFLHPSNILAVAFLVFNCAFFDTKFFNQVKIKKE